MSLPPVEQFISTSLLYNSGILFSKERVERIRDFATGDYLSEVNSGSKRPKLSVDSPEMSIELLKQGQSIPRQLTSWSAVYHVLQRYGAWMALEQFSKAFTESEFADRTER